MSDYPAALGTEGGSPEDEALCMVQAAPVWAPSSPHSATWAAEQLQQDTVPFRSLLNVVCASFLDLETLFLTS